MHRPTIVLRWPVGVVMTASSYMWRTTPMWRSEQAGHWPQDGPPAVAPEVDPGGVQRPEDGVGPLLRRRYRGRITGADTTAEPLMRELGENPNRVTPSGLAHFVKDAGEPGELKVNDAFTVRMPAPWDGPIRVAEVTPRSFRFLTLDGHLEAGQIEWRARDEDDGDLVFEIESWASSGDTLSYVMHNRLPMAKEVQLHMWTRVCERVAARVGGRLEEGIEILTLRVELH
jgi:hypothetical protein